MPKSSELPYLSSVSRRVPLLTIGESSGHKNGAPYVKDSQVVFAVDLYHLPRKASVKDIDSFRLRLPLSKTNDEKNPINTELFCEYKHGLCFGQKIYSKKWKENINDDFFKRASLNSNYFKDNIITKRYQETKGFSKQINIDLVKAWDMPQEELKSVLYENGNRNKTLYFVAADDVFVGSNAYVDLVLKEEVCQ